MAVLNPVKLESLKQLVEPDQFVLLSKYKARRKYVLALRSTNLEGLGVGVSEGYFVMLKLSLAFSAVEMLARVISRKGQLGIQNEVVVKAINVGKFDKLIVATHNDNKRRFSKVDEADLQRWRNLPLDSDLTDFVYQCRNFIFHGSYTPTETGLASSARLRALVLDLAMSTLDAGELALQNWVRKKSRTTPKK